MLMKPKHTRVGKLAKYANVNHQKKAAIKMSNDMIGQHVVVLTKKNYRDLIKNNNRLIRIINKMGRMAKCQMVLMPNKLEI